MRFPKSKKIGCPFRGLGLQGKDIHAVSLDPTDTTLAIASDNLFCLAQIVPSALWAFTINTLLYAYEKNNDSVFTAVFFNRNSVDRLVQAHRGLAAVAGHSGHFLLVTDDCFMLAKTIWMLSTNRIRWHSGLTIGTLWSIVRDGTSTAADA
jgi:hypothetical protein